MIGATLAIYALAMSAEPLPARRDCTAPEMAALTAETDQPYDLRCTAWLGGRNIVRPVRIEGAEASGAGLYCEGGAVGRPGQAVTTRNPTIAVWSRSQGDGGWSRPQDVVIADCTVHGAIRIWGMGAGESMVSLLGSSRQADHTARAQAAAPRRITLDRVDFIGTGSIPLYIGPGVTDVTVSNAGFSGRSVSVAVYLDAESAGNTIRSSQFNIRTGREQIAVDGSARNRIVGNQFNLRRKGGIFLYRNCGEDGVIRHQTPSDNLITDNRFTDASWLRPRAVVVGAREGRRSYCNADAGWPFGSSADDGDRAEGNIVQRNRVQR